MYNCILSHNKSSLHLWQIKQVNYACTLQICGEKHLDSSLAI